MAGRSSRYLAFMWLTSSVLLAQNAESEQGPLRESRVHRAVADEVQWLLSNLSIGEMPAGPGVNVSVYWRDWRIIWCPSWLDVCQTAFWRNETGSLSRMVITKGVPQSGRNKRVVVKAMDICDSTGTSGRRDSGRPALSLGSSVPEARSMPSKGGPLCDVLSSTLSRQAIEDWRATRLMAEAEADAIRHAVEGEVRRYLAAGERRTISIPQIGKDDDVAYVCISGMGGEEVGELVLWHSGEWRLATNQNPNPERDEQRCRRARQRLWFEFEVDSQGR